MINDLILFSIMIVTVQFLFVCKNKAEMKFIIQEKCSFMMNTVHVSVRDPVFSLSSRFSG